MQVYLTGLGALNTNVPDGTAAPTKPLASATEPVTAFVGGLQVSNIQFQGLSPGLGQPVPAQPPDPLDHGSAERSRLRSKPRPARPAWWTSGSARPERGPRPHFPIQAISRYRM